MSSVSWPAVLAGVRRRLAAQPVVRWLLALALAAVAATSIAERQRAAADEHAAWATSRPVLVATATIPAGGELSAAVTELRALPPGAVPPSALAESPTGAVAARPIVAGEVVLAGAVSFARGPAALLPEGATGVAVPLPIGWQPTLGDVVSVYALAPVPVLGAGELESGSPPSGVLSERATIVETTDDGVLLAVPDAEAGPIADAVSTGRAVLLLRRPAPG